MWELFRQYRSFRAALGLAVLFLASFVQSCSELKYSMWGVISTATISKVEPSTTVRDGSYITLNFTDSEGNSCRVARSLSKANGDWSVGDQVQVIYFRGAGERAQLVAERSFLWPIVFLGMSGAVVVWSLLAYRRMEAGQF